MIELADRLEHLVDDCWREPERRLVEHHEVGRRHQAARNREHLLLPARKRAGRLARALRQDRKQRQRAGVVFGTLGARPRHHGTHLQILRHRERREQLPAFRHLSDTEVADAVARPAGDVGSAKRDAAARRLQNPGDGADQRCLTRTIGADDRDDRPLLDRELDAVERLGVAVEHIETLDREHQRASAPR